MISALHAKEDLLNDLKRLGIRPGDGIFVHSSMKAIGYTVGGPRTVVEALLQSVAERGLIAMPGFSTDAYFPPDLEKADLSPEDIEWIENAVPGFDPHRSPTSGVGIVAETFRTWPDTHRSAHPAVSVCLNGADAAHYASDHSLAWATGEHSPIGRLLNRPSTKILLIGVGWNRCTPLHTAETFAKHRRTKTRRMKTGGSKGKWVEEPDVADDVNRLFPAVGAAFEQTGAVTFGTFGAAQCRVCNLKDLIEFASVWIDRANEESGDRR